MVFYKQVLLLGGGLFFLELKNQIILIHTFWHQNSGWDIG